jgi:hypothetical protein
MDVNGIVFLHEQLPACVRIASFFSLSIAIAIKIYSAAVTGIPHACRNIHGSALNDKKHLMIIAQ